MRERLNVVELYAGTGRSSAPFLGWKRSSVSLLVDNDQFAVDTYRANFPKVPYRNANLARVAAAKVNAWAGGRVDVLLGCPPCQGFSDVGARNPDDPRNAHLRRFAYYVANLKPRAVGMENVPLAVSAGQFKKFITTIENAGYVWTAGILNAALRGSVQSRQRFVLVAVRSDVGVTPVFPAPTHGGDLKYFSYRAGKMLKIGDQRIEMLGEAPATQRLRKELPFKEESLGARPIPWIEDVLCDLPRLTSPRAKALAHNAWNHSEMQKRRMGAVDEGGQWKGARDHFAHTYGRLHRKGMARTITTNFNNPGSGRFWHPTENRALTPREAARIQGFPDSFMFAEPFSCSARLIGNALDSSIASMVYDVIRRCLE